MSGLDVTERVVGGQSGHQLLSSVCICCNPMIALAKWPHSHRREGVRWDSAEEAFLWLDSADKHLFSFSSRYIERKAFLDRVDHRQFEIERDLRLSKMKP